MLLAPLVFAAVAHATTCTTPTVAPPRGEPVHVPIEIANSHVFVKVCVGERELSFILDTGAGQTFFDLGVARAVGLNTRNPGRVGGAGAGTVAGAQIDGGAVRLAGTDVAVPVPMGLDLSRIVPREGHAMDGILGYDFIERYVVAIDYVGQELRLYDRNDYKYEGKGTSLPVTFIQGHPHVDAEIRLVDGGTVRGRFLIDVGASPALSLTKPVVDANHLRDRVGPTVRKPTGGGVGGPATSEVGRIAALRIGDAELVAPITLLFGDSAGVLTANGGIWIGIIGGDVLRRFTVFLDYKSKRIIFEASAARDEPFEADMSGAALIGAGDLTHLVVDYVVPRSPAGEAGLAVGDSVVAIDGNALTDQSLTAFRKRSRREGEEIALTVKRGGETKTIQFRTRRIV